MATDFDIWAELKRINDLLNLEISTEDVPAHQDGTTAYANLPRKAQINIDMDHTAENMRILIIINTLIIDLEYAMRRFAFTSPKDQSRNRS